MSRTVILGLIVAWAGFAGTARAESECFPACREGFVCHEGRCISACNPPCGAGEVCTAERTCAAQQGAVETPPPPPNGGSATGGGIPIVEHGSGPQVVATGLPVTPAPYASASGYPPPPAAQYTAPPPAEPAVYDNNFAIHANPVGFLFFGPVLSLEFGGMLSGLVRARFPNAGLIPALQEFCLGSSLFDDCEELDFGLGVGAGLRYYIGNRGNLRGFYLGAAFEIEHRTFSRYDSDLGAEQERNDLRAVVLGNLGYRFPGRVFLVSLGGEVGAAPGGRSGESAFVGSLVVEIGFHL